MVIPYMHDWLVHILYTPIIIRVKVQSCSSFPSSPFELEIPVSATEICVSMGNKIMAWREYSTKERNPSLNLPAAGALTTDSSTRVQYS